MTQHFASAWRKTWPQRAVEWCCLCFARLVKTLALARARLSWAFERLMPAAFVWGSNYVTLSQPRHPAPLLLPWFERTLVAFCFNPISVGVRQPQDFKGQPRTLSFHLKRSQSYFYLHLVIWKMFRPQITAAPFWVMKMDEPWPRPSWWQQCGVMCPEKRFALFTCRPV